MSNKLIAQFLVVLCFTFVLFSCSSNDKKQVANQIEINEPENVPEVKQYHFKNSGYPPINLVGKNYSIPMDPEGVIKKLQKHQNEFLGENHASGLTLSENKLYTIFYNYSPEGFTALMGYPVDASAAAPDGLTSMTVPGGQYGIFPFVNDSDSSYYQAWEAAEKVKDFRSFQTDIEVYAYDKPSNSISKSELRVHLK